MAQPIEPVCVMALVGRVMFAEDRIVRLQCPARLLLSRMVTAGIDDHAVEPCCELAFPTEGAELVRQSQADILGYVLRVFDIAREAEGVPVGSIVVPLQQALERGTVAPACLSCQFTIIIRHGSMTI